MASFHGLGGDVRWDTTGTEDVIEKVTQWTADINVEVGDDNGMGDVFKSRLPGLFDWSAEVTCNTLVIATGFQVPIVTGGVEALGENTPATLELFFDKIGGAGNVGLLVGTAIATNISTSVSVDGIAQTTYSFEGQGAITFVTTEP